MPDTKGIGQFFCASGVEYGMRIYVVVAVTAPAELVFKYFAEKEITASYGEFFNFEAFRKLYTSCKGGVAATGSHFKRTEACRTLLFAPKIGSIEAVEGFFNVFLNGVYADISVG